MRKDGSVVFQFDLEIERTVRRLRREQRNSKIVSSMNNLQDVGNLEPHGPLQPVNVQEEQNEHANQRQPGDNNIIYMADDRDRAIRDYAVLTPQVVHPGIIRPEVEAANFELKPVMFQMLQTVGQFNGLPNEDPHLHLKLFLEAMTSAPTVVKQVAELSCVYYGEEHDFDNCPGNPASVNYVGNFNRQLQNNSYSNTYNPGWKQHPNFSWSRQNRNAPILNRQNRNTQPPDFHQQGQGQNHISQDPITSLEALIKEYITNNEAIVQSQAVSLRNLKNQMGQLATAMSSMTQGNLPSNTEDPRREGKENTTKGQATATAEGTQTVHVEKEVATPVATIYNKPNKQSLVPPEASQQFRHPPPFLQRFQKQKQDKQFSKFLNVLKQLHINIPFVEALEQMLNYVKFLKDILARKRRLGEFKTIALTQENNHMLQSKMPTKVKDPGSFTIPYSIGTRYTGRALCDLGASINLMPLSVFKQLGVGEYRPTTVTLQLADRSHVYPEGKIEDVLVNVDKFIFPVDFIVLEFEADKEQVTFNVLEAMKNPDEVEDCNFLSVVDFVVADRMEKCFNNEINKVTTFEDLEEEDVAANQIDWMEEKQSDRHNKFIEHLNLSDREVKTTLPSIESPHILELKLLHSHLKYIYLGQNNTLPVIMSSTLNAGQEQSLVDLLGRYRRIIAWTMADIKGISPSIWMHKILLEDCHNNWVEHQRRLNPIMKEVVKKKIIKWLDAGIIYPISDSSWVSPVQCVPKKGGITTIANERDELIPTRTVTRWRVCMECRKLNKSTRKYHFPLPFIDKMLDRLAGKQHYCFLDRYSGYNQIAIASDDQEKTTFICPYRTFTFRRMPLGCAMLKQLFRDA
ncbi:hypothetical protein KPL70_007340 [Citrus sinensis]|nr:hypothetical protein KPL70_007340 [Citrus sinensis]